MEDCSQGGMLGKQCAELWVSHHSSRCLIWLPWDKKNQWQLPPWRSQVKQHSLWWLLYYYPSDSQRERYYHLWDVTTGTNITHSYVTDHTNLNNVHSLSNGGYECKVLCAHRSVTADSVLLVCDAMSLLCCCQWVDGLYCIMTAWNVTNWTPNDKVSHLKSKASSLDTYFTYTQLIGQEDFILNRCHKSLQLYKIITVVKSHHFVPYIDFLHDISMQEGSPI